MAEWWENFFDADYLRVYEDHDMDRAEAEAAFVQKVLKLRRGQRVLDVCCGYGRHAVLFAKAGLDVTGFDRSRLFIGNGKRAARKARVKVTWVQGDVRTMVVEPDFHAAVSLFTSIGFFSTEDENYQVVARSAAALKPGGQFLLDTFNRDSLVRCPHGRNWQPIRGGIMLASPAFDIEKSRLTVERTLILQNGRRRMAGFSLRIYTLAEVVAMFERASLEVTRTYGDFRGSKYTLDSPRIIVVGRKRSRK